MAIRPRNMKNREKSWNSDEPGEVMWDSLFENPNGFAHRILYGILRGLVSIERYREKSIRSSTYKYFFFIKFLPKSRIKFKYESNCPYEKKVLVSMGSSTFFANFQYFRAKKVLDPILTNIFFSYGWKTKTETSPSSARSIE